MSTVSNPCSFSDPDSFDPSADSGPSRDEWAALTAWASDDGFPDEAPELDEPFEPDPEDAEWFAAATLARPALCRSVPPSAHGAEIDLP